MKRSTSIRPQRNLGKQTRSNGHRRLVFEGLESRDLLTAGLVVSTAIDELDGDHSPGDLSLREALALAAARPGDDVIEFDASLHGATITLDAALGQLEIDSNVVAQSDLDGALYLGQPGLIQVAIPNNARYDVIQGFLHQLEPPDTFYAK